MDKWICIGYLESFGYGDWSHGMCLHEIIEGSEEDAKSCALELAEQVWDDWGVSEFDKAEDEDGGTSIYENECQCDWFKITDTSHSLEWYQNWNESYPGDFVCNFCQ